MKNLSKYKKKLEALKNDLKDFDGDILDKDYKVLKKAFDVAYESEAFRLYDIEPSVIDAYKIELFKNLTQISGNLSFLAIQILAANTIMNKNNFSKKQEYFDKKCGIAINHLRADKTIVSATKCESGYLLNGKLTWASGYNIFDTLVIGFRFEDNEYEVVSPFLEQEGFNIGEVDDTFVGYGLNTVNIQLENYFVKEENIISSHEIGNYNKNKSISKTVHMCLYSLGYSTYLQIEDEDLKTFASIKLENIKDKFMSTKSPEELDILRIEIFNLVQMIISTAMMIKGGKSILLSNSLQRYYRELMMFNANGLNQRLKDIIKNDFKTKFQ